MRICSRDKPRLAALPPRSQALHPTNFWPWKEVVSTNSWVRIRSVAGRALRFTKCGRFSSGVVSSRWSLLRRCQLRPSHCLDADQPGRSARHAEWSNQGRWPTQRHGARHGPAGPPQRQTAQCTTRRYPMSIRNLDSLFSPASVAIFGASNRPASVGGTVWRNMHGGRFAALLPPLFLRPIRFALRPHLKTQQLINRAAPPAQSKSATHTTE